MRIDSERGAGRIGCLVSLVLILVFLFLSFKVAPVYLDKLDFEDGLARIASRAGVESWPPKTVKERVIDLARSKDFEVTPEDVQVTAPLRFQPVPEIKIDVRYRRQVELPGYVHVFHFESKASSFVGRL